MNMLFAETLKRLRKEKGITQRDLAERLFVTRTTVNRWENGNRLPDAAMIAKLSEVFEIDINILFSARTETGDSPNIIIVDDNKIVLNGSLPILRDVLPGATVTGFTKSAETIEFAKQNNVSLAFLDIEMGTVSGLDVCRELLQFSPRTNVVYLTAYPSYAFDAWETGACGFMLKPISAEGILKQLSNLRYPFM